MPTLAELEEDLVAQDAILEEWTALLAEEPDSQEISAMIQETLDLKEQTVSQIALLKSNDAVSSPAPAVVANAAVNIDYTANSKVNADPTANQERRVFKINETVSAKYSGDRQFYPATIVSVMGSAAAPVYTVTFKGYSGTETVRAHDIRPVTNSATTSQKRKADGFAAVSSSASTPQNATPVNNGSVLSAPASINTALAEALKRDPGKALDEASKPEKRRRKTKTDKSLDQAKSNWQSWQQKTSTGKIAKVANKESMFRIGEKPGAKVGFTGSGHTMRKDADRTRHQYYMPPEDSSRH